MELLVTGFGPFPSMPRNPSAALAHAVAASPRWRLRGDTAKALILTTAYAALTGELDPALASGPDAVLMIGVAGRSKSVRVERRATSRRSTLFPDVTGETATRAGTTSARRSAVASEAAFLTIRRHGIAVRISRDAGRYLCNAAYFRTLARPHPVLFIHIPKPPPAGRPAAPSTRHGTCRRIRLAAALVEIGIAMLRDARIGRIRQLGRPLGAFPAPRLF